MQKYSRQLADQEGQLAVLRDQVRALNQRKTASEKRLRDLITKISF